MLKVNKHLVKNMLHAGAMLRIISKSFYTRGNATLAPVLRLNNVSRQSAHPIASSTLLCSKGICSINQAALRSTSPAYHIGQPLGLDILPSRLNYVRDKRIVVKMGQMALLKRDEALDYEEEHPERLVVYQLVRPPIRFEYLNLAWIMMASSQFLMCGALGEHRVFFMDEVGWYITTSVEAVLMTTLFHFMAKSNVYRIAVPKDESYPSRAWFTSRNLLFKEVEEELPIQQIRGIDAKGFEKCMDHKGSSPRDLILRIRDRMIGYNLHFSALWMHLDIFSKLVRVNLEEYFEDVQGLMMRNEAQNRKAKEDGEEEGSLSRKAKASNSSKNQKSQKGR